MSCNGCRVLRKGCSETCMLRSCLQWIDTPEAQGNATLFLAKFFGRSDLLSLVAAVPHPQRPALFQSLLFEACGRTVNPVDGAVGLLSSGNWHVCRAAVETVLSGGTLIRPTPPTTTSAGTGPKPNSVVDRDEDSAPPARSNHPSSDGVVMTAKRGRGRSPAMSFYSDTTSFQSNKRGGRGNHRPDKKLLNLFV